MLNKSLAAALLCGAIGLTGTALAQVGTPDGATKNATGSANSGPGAIGSSAGSTIGSAPAWAAASGNTSSYGASGNASASASGSLQADKPNFLSSVQSKSTPARGLKGTAMKRVDDNERKVTAELNRASASSTGNANASNQASINSGVDSNIQ